MAKQSKSNPLMTDEEMHAPMTDSQPPSSDDVAAILKLGEARSRLKNEISRVKFD